MMRKLLILLLVVGMGTRYWLWRQSGRTAEARNVQGMTEEAKGVALAAEEGGTDGSALSAAKGANPRGESSGFWAATHKVGSVRGQESKLLGGKSKSGLTSAASVEEGTGGEAWIGGGRAVEAQAGLGAGLPDPLGRSVGLGGVGKAAEASGLRGAGVRSGTPRLPLAFQIPEPVQERLNEGQRAGVSQLQQSFIDAIGGPNADTNSAEYLQRWQRAQPASDMQFRGFFGQQAFLDYNLKAGQEAGQP